MTLKHWLISGALAVAVIPVSAELYRWVDSSGTVHYSDTPREGAEKITLKPTNVIRSQQPQAVPTNSSAATENTEQGESSAPVKYTEASIQSPTADQVLWNIGATLNVQINIEPELQEGHGVVLFYDGRPVNPNPVVSSSITIDNVFRGQHTVRAAIQDLEGNTIFNGASVTFMVQQSTGG